MSARTRMVGPAPFLSTPTTPVPPTLVQPQSRVVQFLREPGGGLLLLEGEFGMGVHVLVGASSDSASASMRFVIASCGD